MTRNKKTFELLLEQTPLVVYRGKKEQEIAFGLQKEGKARITSTTSFRSGNRKFVTGGFMTKP